MRPPPTAPSDTPTTGQRRWLRHLPNLLALSRIVTAPLLVALILHNTSASLLAAWVWLLLLAISDIVDGPLARKLNAVSPLGVFLDTIADKVMVLAVLLPLIELGRLSAWAALLLIGRDLLVSGVRAYAATQQVVLPPGTLGKRKIVLLVASLLAGLLLAAGEQGGWLPAHLALPLGVFYTGGLWGAVLLAVISATHYIASARTIITKP